MSSIAHYVHAALIEIVAKEGGLSSQEAAEYVKGLQNDKRYLRDRTYVPTLAGFLFLAILLDVCTRHVVG